MTLPLTQHELDDLCCNKPGCSHENDNEVWLTSHCHPGPIEVSYVKSRGVLVIRCKKCQSQLIEIEVAQ